MPIYAPSLARARLGPKGSGVHVDDSHNNPALPCPAQIWNSLVVLSVRHWDMRGVSRIGEIVIAQKIAAQVVTLFEALYFCKFPIASIRPICEFGWDDEESMRANNTSGFNYRFISGTEKLSNHAYGLAIDINPWLNPHVIQGVPYPSGAVYDPRIPGTIVARSPVVRIFERVGGDCGYRWPDPDYQHVDFL